MAIGIQSSHDLGGIAVQYMVDGNGRLVGLIKVDGGVLTNVKGIPVTAEGLTVLIDVKCIIGLDKTGRARIYFSPCGQSVVLDGCLDGQRQHSHAK